MLTEADTFKTHREARQWVIDELAKMGALS